MATLAVLRIDEAGFRETFQSRNSDVGRDLSARATRVQRGARRQVGVKTGLLRRSIVKHWVDNGAGTANRGDLVIRVGSPLNYALLHHTGTRPHVIRPRPPHRALRFVVDGRVVFATKVNHPGTKPNPYLTANLPLALK